MHSAELLYLFRNLILYLILYISDCELRKFPNLFSMVSSKSKQRNLSSTYIYRRTFMKLKQRLYTCLISLFNYVITNNKLVAVECEIVLFLHINTHTRPCETRESNNFELTN